MSSTAKPETAKPEMAAPGHRMGAIKNAPVVHNDGGYEKKVTPPKIVAGMAGHNAGGFETRVSQEAGTH